MTLLSWDIPLISFNGSLWDVLLRCSKWLLWAWLDSFTMILRCWLVVWVKWARPLVSMTLWSRVMFNWKAVQLRGRPISWAVLHHWKSMGQILVPSCPPGVQLLPHFEVWSYRACQPLQMWQIFTFLWNPLSELRGVKSFLQCKVNGATLGRSCPPGVQLLPHFEVWSYRACQPLEMWQISHFCEIHSLSYEASKFFLNVKSMRFFLPLFCPWGKHRTPDRL